MAITIKKVSSKKELKTFIRFNYELYKENPYSVPDLYDDMLNTFSPKKNAACSAGSADAVDIGLRHFRQIVVEHAGHILDRKRDLE